MAAPVKIQAIDPLRVLLTFTGFHDPFAAKAVSGNEQEGPVLSLARIASFDRIVLISTPGTKSNTDETVRALASRHPDVGVQTFHLELEDPTDYFAILSGIRSIYQSIREKDATKEYFIGTASGTPQMHACWVMLAASGEIPARLLHARNVKFVTSDKPFVEEIDTTRPEFPTIRTSAWANVEAEDGEASKPNDLIRQLGIIGDEPEMTEALQRAVNVAGYDVPVLILGESGTGKERIAGLIHQASNRAKGPLVPVNCAAIPEKLAESMLFGHIKGSFSGATANAPGAFVRAEKGTLFLDELAELSPSIQAKLLRALQDQVIEPVGAKQAKKIDCRVIAATNSDLEEAVKAGKFREDLFYRIAVTTINVPALRDRPSDISKLAQHFLDEMNAKYRKPRRFAPDALAALSQYRWPGNVRELLNVIQEAAIHAPKGVISRSHLRLRGLQPSESTIIEQLPEPHEGFNMDAFIGEIRERLYRRSLELAGDNASQAARLLGVTPQAVTKFRRSAGDST